MTKKESKPKAKTKPKAKQKQRARGKLSARNAGKNPVGRPGTTIKDLPKDWGKIMIALAEDGKGVTAWMNALDIGHSALNTLLEKSDQFRYTYEKCQIKCQLWYEDRGQDMVKGVQGNATVWSLNMSNRFGYQSQRQQISGDKSAPLVHEFKKTELTDDEVMAELASRGLPTSLFIKD